VAMGNGIAAMFTDDIRIVHATPGRIRLKVTQSRKAQALANQLQQRLVSLSGVQSVSVNSLTGSVLICYNADSVDSQEFQRAFSEPLTALFPGVFPVAFASWSSPIANGLASQASPLSEHVKAFFNTLNANVDQLTSGSADLKILVPLALFLLGVRGLISSDRLLHRRRLAPDLATSGSRNE